MRVTLNISRQRGVSKPELIVWAARISSLRYELECQSPELQNITKFFFRLRQYS